MDYTIQNDFLTVTVSDLGAELMSVKTKDGHEYLWQGDEKYWAGRAPIMFPICGRLFNGEYTYLGKTYTLPNHGFARKSTFKLKSVSKSFVTLELEANEETLEQYPFNFVFDVTFSLKDNCLDIGSLNHFHLIQLGYKTQLSSIHLKGFYNHPKMLERLYIVHYFQMVLKLL